MANAAPAAQEETLSQAEDKSILEGAQAPDKTSEPTAKPADGSDKPADAPKEGNKPPEQKSETSKAEGAPEKYESFKAPEGITLDAKAVEDFTVLAKELNLSQASAQKLVDFQASQIKAAQESNLKSFEEMQKEWATETRKSLGANADKELGFAAVARDKFLNAEITINGEKTTATKILNASGLANHPAIIKSLISIGKAISEDKFVEGKGDKGSNEGKTAAQIIYPNQK